MARASTHMRVEITQTFEKAYREESDAIFRFCLLRVGNRDQALDITQEAFLRLWKCLKDDQEVKNFRAFLFTITHRLIIDWYRKKKSFSLDKLMSVFTGKEEESSWDPPDDSSLQSEIDHAEGSYLIEKINTLPPSLRQPVYLRFVEDLTPQEIGQILGISANAAGVRVQRGLDRLRKDTQKDT